MSFDVSTLLYLCFQDIIHKILAGGRKYHVFWYDFCFVLQIDLVKMNMVVKKLHAKIHD